MSDIAYYIQELFTDVMIITADAISPVTVVLLFMAASNVFVAWYVYTNADEMQETAALFLEMHARIKTLEAQSIQRDLATRTTVTDLALEVQRGLESLRGGSRKTQWVSQERCGAVLRQLFPKHVFAQNVRPKWNLNPVTKRALELDWYCEELKLAVEYQGEQHYKPVAKFHGADEKVAEKKFAEQRARDLLKQANCDAMGVHLVCVPFTYRDRVREFLLRDAGVVVILATYLDDVKSKS